jgi:2-phospho-L-lactate guanylyltransferase
VVAVVIPFREGGKGRLPDAIRQDAALAMLGDVVEAALALGLVRVVTDDSEAGELALELGAVVVADPGGGQGAAVAAGLAGLVGPSLIVNADCPRVTVADLDVLVASARNGRLGVVEARDGTTNALALPRPEVFAPLYGVGSADRFRALAKALELPIDDIALSNLVDDVDTLADLERVAIAAGRRTRALLATLDR